MFSKKYRLAFFGTTYESIIVLQALLINPKYKIVCVITPKPKPAGRKLKIIPSQLAKFSTKKGLNLIYSQTVKEKNYLIENISELKNKLQNLNPQLFIIAYFGQKIPQLLLQIPIYGALNIHPSLLPQYRGASPVQWAILEGKKQSGVTIVKINKDFDQGEIVAQKKIKIRKSDTAKDLYIKLFTIGASLLTKKLSLYLEGKIKLKKQNQRIAAYYPRLKREDGFIKPEEFNRAIDQGGKIAFEIERKVRAFDPWPGTYTYIYKHKPQNEQPKSTRLKILKAHIKDGKLIPDLVQFEGKKPTI